MVAVSRSQPSSAHWRTEPASNGQVCGAPFAPYTGGPFSYIDTMGAKAFAKLCERLAKSYGPRFKPNELLKDIAAKNDTFSTRFAPRRRRRRPPPSISDRHARASSTVALAKAERGHPTFFNRDAARPWTFDSPRTPRVPG